LFQRCQGYFMEFLVVIGQLAAISEKILANHPILR